MTTSTAIFLFVLAIVTLTAIGCAVFAPRLPIPARLLAAALFVPVALFSVFGFLASFEPGDGHRYWTAGYVTLLAGCLFAIARLVIIRRPRTHDSELPSAHANSDV